MSAETIHLALPRTGRWVHRPSQSLLVLLDRACLFLVILWLSRAWYFPSSITTDAAPGIRVIDLAFQAACLYGALRLLMLRPTAVVLAEPLFLLFLLLGVSSLLTTSAFGNTLGMVRTCLLFFATCIFFRYRYPPPDIARTLLDLLGALLVLSVIAALLIPFGTMQGFDAGRWKGVFGHKNALGQCAAFALILLCGCWSSRTAPCRRDWVFGAATLACLAGAQSATALGVAALGLGVLASNRFFARARVPWSVAMASQVLLAAGAVLLLPSVLAPLAQSLGRDITFTGRTEIWARFLDFAWQRPWTGWGWATIDSSEHMLPLVRLALGLPTIQTPHSGYLSLFVELGLPALMVYCLWLLSVFFGSTRRALLRLDPVWSLRAALAAGLALLNGFESTAQASPSLWLFALLVIGTRKRVIWR